MKIGLSVIMKDEEKVLLRMLNSVYKIIDYYVVVDTGSTDNSRKIVKDFFDSKGIPGEVLDFPYETPWNGEEMLDQWRNYSLNKLRESGKVDYGFWIDCDEQLRITPAFNLELIKERLSSLDSAACTTVYGDTTYPRSNFINLKTPFYWDDPVHAWLVSPVGYQEGFIPEASIFVTADGNTWKDKTAKFLRHASIYEREYKKKPTARNLFYLAQSYRDAGKLEEAIKWYKKRVEIQENNEQRYQCQFMIGCLLSHLGKEEEALYNWFKCSELDNLRGEHFVNIIVKLQKDKLFDTSYLFSKMAVEKFHGKNPFPLRRICLDEATYTHKLIELHNYSCRVLNVPEILRTEVDICIISNAKTDILYNTTIQGIKTLLNSEHDIKFNIFIVETEKTRNYDIFPNTKTIYTDEPFGYHRYLNIAVKEGKSAYVVLCNNDLTYNKYWATEIIKAMQENPDILSASPFCPQVNKPNDSNVKLGYGIRKEIAGWCIFQQRKIYDIIGKLDEQYDFWGCDNSYSVELHKNNVKHALVQSSVVNHHDKSLGISGETILSKEEKHRLTVVEFTRFKQNNRARLNTVEKL